jgi:TolB-like protein
MIPNEISRMGDIFHEVNSCILGSCLPLLSYLVIETLEGRSDHLKEYSIGIAVFGKEPTFDPRLDSIVRVEAHKLRARLAKYFDTEGKSDPVRVELPVGRYLPVFGTGAALSRQAARAYRTPSRDHLAFRVAVLPFDNRSAGTRDQFFADGLTDELNHVLAGIRELDVVSRTSASQFNGRQIDVRELAARLDVDAVIEGSIRRFGDHLRILVQLDDGADGRTVLQSSG